MFELVRNDFVKNGSCEYEDEYGNRAVLRRNEKGFSAKLWYKEPSVKTKPLQVDMFTGEEVDGAYMHIDFLDPKFKGADFVNGGAFNLSAIIQHWIDLLHDIAFLGANNETLKMLYAKENPTDEDCYLGKYQRISEYEELKELLEQIGLTENKSPNKVLNQPIS